MIHKSALCLKAVRLYNLFHDRGATIGEVSKRIGYSKSTTRRVLIQLVNWGYLSFEMEEYKSTGRRVYNMTEEGYIWLADYRELI